MRSRRHPNIAQLLFAAREAMLKPFRPILNAHGLTGQQWRVIRALGDSEGGLAPREIAEQCQILAPSLSQILAGMEKNGMLQRARCGVDMRKQIVTLTPASQELVDLISPLIERQYALIERVAGRQLLVDAADVAQRLQQALDAGVPNVMDEAAPAAADKRSPRK